MWVQSINNDKIWEENETSRQEKETTFDHTCMEMCQTAQLCRKNNLWTTCGEQIFTKLFPYVYYHPLYLLQLLNARYMMHKCSKVYWNQHYSLLLLCTSIVLSMCSILSKLTKSSSLNQSNWCTNIWSIRVYHTQMVMVLGHLCISIMIYN